MAWMLKSIQTLDNLPENVKSDKLGTFFLNDLKHHRVIGCELLQST